MKPVSSRLKVHVEKRHSGIVMAVQISSLQNQYILKLKYTNTQVQNRTDKK